MVAEDRIPNYYPVVPKLACDAFFLYLPFSLHLRWPPRKEVVGRMELSGPMQTDFPITMTLDGRVNWKRFTTKLGDGGAPVRVVTTNGPVTLRRQK